MQFSPALAKCRSGQVAALYHWREAEEEESCHEPSTTLAACLDWPPFPEDI